MPATFDSLPCTPKCTHPGHKCVLLQPARQECLALPALALDCSTGSAIVQPVRRKVQLFYRTHVVAALAFVVFGIWHWSGNLYYMATGLVVYGIDVAYRWFQTRKRVCVTVAADHDAKLLSLVIPLEVRTRCPCSNFAGLTQQALRSSNASPCK